MRCFFYSLLKIESTYLTCGYDTRVTLNVEWCRCRCRDGVRQRHGVLFGQSARHSNISTRKLHPHVSAPRSAQVRLLALQNVAKQRFNRSAFTVCWTLFREPQLSSCSCRCAVLVWQTVTVQATRSNHS